MRVVIKFVPGYLIKFAVEKMIEAAIRDRTVVGGFDEKLCADYASAVRGNVVATLLCGGDPDDEGEWREYSLLDHKSQTGITLREPDALPKRQGLVDRAIKIYEQENPDCNYYRDFSWEITSYEDFW